MYDKVHWLLGVRFPMVAPSSILFHGPSSEFACLQAGTAYGRELHPPFGREGLSKDEAREIVTLSSSVPVGGRNAFLMAGPMDDVPHGTSDVLLKTLEEPMEGGPRLFLWARDLGSVSSTIRSRCLHQWCPGEEASSDLLIAAKAILDGVGSGSHATVLFGVLDQKGREEDLLKACVTVMAESMEKSEGKAWNVSFSILWSSIRRVLQRGHPITTAMALSAFLSPIQGTPG